MSASVNHHTVGANRPKDVHSRVIRQVTDCYSNGDRSAFSRTTGQSWEPISLWRLLDVQGWDNSTLVGVIEAQRSYES